MDILLARSGRSGDGLPCWWLGIREVRTLVAHEPPAARELPDREQALAAVVDIRETYEREGLGPAMAKFITLEPQRAHHPRFADQPPPNPAEFGPFDR